MKAKIIDTGEIVEVAELHNNYENYPDAPNHFAYKEDSLLAEMDSGEIVRVHTDRGDRYPAVASHTIER
jgi:hypothetical protein